MSLKLHVKFKTPEEHQVVMNLSRYLHMTETNFIRVATLKAVKDITDEVLKKEKEAKLKAEEEQKNVQHSTTDSNISTQENVPIETDRK